MLLLGLLLTGALLVYFRLRAKALSPSITEARLQALQARIRPHFLFNSITAVLSLVRSNPRQAEVALEDMADLFRVLMRDNRELTPLKDEVELCRQYLALEKLRLGERLQVEWHLQSMPRGSRQQVEVVVAENRHRRIAQCFHFAQDGERIGAAIDEVADEPQPIFAGGESDQLEQLAELGVTALDVADRVQAHRKNEACVDRWAARISRPS